MDQSAKNYRTIQKLSGVSSTSSETYWPDFQQIESQGGTLQTEKKYFKSSQNLNYIWAWLQEWWASWSYSHSKVHLY